RRTETAAISGRITTPCEANLPEVVQPTDLREIVRDLAGPNPAGIGRTEPGSAGCAAADSCAVGSRSTRSRSTGSSFAVFRSTGARSAGSHAAGPAPTGCDPT